MLKKYKLQKLKGGILKEEYVVVKTKQQKIKIYRNYEVKSNLQILFQYISLSVSTYSTSLSLGFQCPPEMDHRVSRFLFGASTLPVTKI